MLRLVLLAVLAGLPLLASAHGGHHSTAPEGRATVAADTNGTVRAVAAAPSRCPGSGDETCCCHDATCTPSLHPVAMDARSAERSTPPVCEEQVSQSAVDAPRTAAPARHSQRGPPTRS